MSGVEKKLPNKALDAILGTIGVVGLVIQLIRRNDNQISWGYFIGGFIAATIAWILLFSVCVVAIDSTINEVTEGGSSSSVTVPTFGSLDSSIKNNVAALGSRPTDSEIRLACEALEEADWDYFAMDFSSNRTVSIAAAITTYASGDRLVDYCKSK